MDAEEKDIIIFDTNFVVGNKSTFANIIKQLQEKADVFLPEIVLQERLSQQWRELKERFDEIEKIKTKHVDLISSLQYKSTFEVKYKKKKESVIKLYEAVFGKDKIIPIDSTSFAEILDRAYKKLPLFKEEKNASDSGFKDTMLWLSLVTFFQKYKTSQNVVLMTDDKVFTYYKENLQKEFKEKTSLNIIIQNGEYYKVLLGEVKNIDVNKEHKESIETEVDLSAIRKRIADALFEFTEIYDEGRWQNRFTIDKAIDKTQALWIINNLETKRREYLLSKFIPADKLFGEDYKIKGYYYIPIETLDEIAKIKEYLEINFREGLEPFYIEFANCINGRIRRIIDDDDLPF